MTLTKGVTRYGKYKFTMADIDDTHKFYHNNGTWTILTYDHTVNKYDVYIMNKEGLADWLLVNIENGLRIVNAG